MEEGELFKEVDIVNKEYYEGIKSMVNCSICLEIIKDPVQCDKCQHCFCSQCSKLLKECPFRCQNSHFIPSILCKQLLSELKIKCQCGEEINYDFLEKHKDEECIKTDFKESYYKLKKEYEQLKQEINKMNEPKNQYCIKSNLHSHPLKCIKNFFHAWNCDKCRQGFSEDIPSYKCSLCEFDLCYNCAKNSITKGTLNNKMLEVYRNRPRNLTQFQIISFLHKHPIECNRRFLHIWQCDNCGQSFNDNVPSYQCSLCNFDLCYRCAKNSAVRGIVIDKMLEYYNNNEYRNPQQYNNRSQYNQPINGPSQYLQNIIRDFNRLI